MNTFVVYRVVIRSPEATTGGLVKFVNIPIINDDVIAGNYSSSDLFEAYSYLRDENNLPLGITLIVDDSRDAYVNRYNDYFDVIKSSDLTDKNVIFDNGSYFYFTDKGYTGYYYNGKTAVSGTKPSGYSAWSFPAIYTSDNVTYSRLSLSGAAGSVTVSALPGAVNPMTYNFYNGMPTPPPEPSDDPYEDGGGESSSGGGGGTFTPGGTAVDIPDPPVLSSALGGFCTLYSPSVAQLQSLASYMWTNPAFDVTHWKKVFADPMDAILGLSIVPVTPTTSSATSVFVGNINTGVSMPIVGSRYVDVSCGSITLSEFWGSYLDYSPYTSVELYLPFIGTHSLDTDIVMNKTISITYRIDVLSGACIAFVSCGGTVIYSFIGECAMSIPVAGNDWTNMLNGVLNIAGSALDTANSGTFSASGFTALASASVNLAKPNISKSGSLSGSGGMMGVPYPYLIVTRPRQAVPGTQNKFIGYPSFITKTLSDVVGYTEIDKIHLENIPATADELSEIESLLKSGVII